MLVFFRWLFTKAVVLLLFLIFAFLIYSSSTAQKILYPMLYKDYVLQYAEENEMDPYFIMSVIKAESGFDPQAQSDSGAKGLMQLMPDTAQGAAQHLEIAYDQDKLYEPEYNIKIGCGYLKELSDIYDGDLTLALAAYNAGQGHINLWIKEGLWDGSLERIEDVPFPETRNYVKKVMASYKKYLVIYQAD